MAGNDHHTENVVLGPQRHHDRGPLADMVKASIGWPNASAITGMPERNTPPVVDPSTGTRQRSAEPRVNTSARRAAGLSTGGAFMMSPGMRLSAECSARATAQEGSGGRLASFRTG